MRKTLLTLFAGATIATLVSTYAVEQDCNGSIEESVVATVFDIIQGIGSGLLKHLFIENPSMSCSVSGLQTFLTLAQLCSHATNKEDHEKILNILNVDNKEKLEKLILSVRNIVRSNKNIKGLEFIAVANISNEFTTSFKNKFAKMFYGRTKNIDFSSNNNREVTRFSSPDPGPFQLQKYSFENNNMMLTSDFEFIIDVHHYYNPTGLKPFDFHESKCKVVPGMGLYGNGYMGYAEDLELDAKILKMWLKGGKCYSIFVTPNDTNKMPQVVEKYSNTTNFNEAVASLKQMCVKFKSTLGAAHMTYNIIPYLRHLSLELNGYEDVFENSNANMCGILQHFQLTIGDVLETDAINSPLCPESNKCMPEVTIDKPFAYWLVCGLPLACGVYMGQKYN